jgi:hypothetical protein
MRLRSRGRPQSILVKPTMRVEGDAGYSILRRPQRHSAASIDKVMVDPGFPDNQDSEIRCPVSSRQDPLKLVSPGPTILAGL